MPDPYSYTPMYVVSSCFLLFIDPQKACGRLVRSHTCVGILDIARSVFLSLSFHRIIILLGGDVNITDSDGDTPLYTVENIETARFLVEHGAIVARQNSEGVSVSVLPCLAIL